MLRLHSDLQNRERRFDSFTLCEDWGYVMVERIPLTAEEFDAFGYWREYLFWQRGELKAVKRGYNKRFRKAGKREAERSAE